MKRKLAVATALTMSALMGLSLGGCGSTGCYQPEVIHWDREDLYNLIHAKA